MKELIVIDASVFVTEIFGKAKRTGTNLQQLLRDTTIQVSLLSFTALEFANGVRFSTRDTQMAEDAIKKFTALNIPVIPITTADVAAVTALSYQLGTTVYDTAYHYIAILNKGRFITCDAAYYKKASHLGHIELWR